MTTPSRVAQLRQLLEDAIAVGDQDKIDIIKAELFQINPNYKDGGEVKYYKDGGKVQKKKSKLAGRLATRGYGKARK